MRVIGGAVIAGGLLACSAANAAEWWFVGSTGGDDRPNRTIFLVDMASRQPLASTRWTIETAHVRETADANGRKSDRTRYRIDCAAGTTAVTASTDYRADRTVLRERTIAEADQKEGVPPAMTIAEAVRDTACGKPPLGAFKIDDKLEMLDWATAYFNSPAK